MNISIGAKLEGLGVEIEKLDEGMKAAFHEVVAGVAVSAQNEWVRRAQTKLHTSRDIYISGLRQAESFSVKGVGDTKTYEVQLVGKMPNNFEFGMESFDMKQVRPGWLGGGKARTAKDGHKYVVIPFRHSTTSNTNIDYTGKAKAQDLKTKLKATVKQYGLDRMKRTASGQVVEGPTARVPNASSVHSYLRGLTRIQKGISGTTKAGQRGSSQLLTWRVMSENSPASSWIHPGLTAVNLLPDIERWVDKELDKILDVILGAG